jgi:RNA-directed DNA polymerase
MQEPYGEGVASHTGPESCVAAREGGDEALTGVRAGRVLSRENPLTSECRRRLPARKAMSGASLARDASRTLRGQRPRARTETPHVEPGRPCVWPRTDRTEVCGENPQGARRR